MPIKRTAKGTVSSKASATTLTLSDVTVRGHTTLVVGIVYVDTAGDPTSIKWGHRNLDQIIVRSQSGISCAIWTLRHIKDTRTRNITATWSSEIAAKAMFATQIRGANIQDVSRGNTQTSTTSPTTGSAATTTKDNTIHIAAFGSKGPANDEVGTVNTGHISGQRVGTGGAPPVSNVTIHETFKKLSNVGNCRSAKTGAQQRDWANVIVAFRKTNINRCAISPADLGLVEQKFDSLSYQMKDAVFWYNEVDDRWEVYVDSRLTTMIAHQANGWI